MASSAVVRTVLGSVPPEMIGFTSMHEHMVWAAPGWEYAPEAGDIFDLPEVFHQLHEGLVRYREAGGRTIVNLSGLGLGRDLDLLRVLSRGTGVHIVACTGFWAEQLVAPYFAMRDIDYHVELFTRELTVGMAGSRIPAGCIKVGNSADRITPLEEMLYRAAARAAVKTGAPVVTHGVNCARQQLQILREEGMEPERIVISHCDAAYSIDLERDLEIARQGAHVAYDHIGSEPPESVMPYAMSDHRRIELIQAFLDRGAGDRLVLACDSFGWRVGLTNWNGASPKGFAHLPRTFVPQLVAAGVSEDVVHRIFVETPRRILAF